MFPSVEELDICANADSIAAAIAWRDRFDAKLAEAIGTFDGLGLWDLDAATSMTAWLRDRASMTRRDAAALAQLAARLRMLPVTAAFFATGELSRGQVQTAVAIAGAKLDLFASHEPALVPTLVSLSVDDTARVMAEWRRRADDDDPAPPPEPERTLYLSKVGGRGALDGDLDEASTDIVATALGLAMSNDVVGSEPTRNPAEKRADALVDICKHFLDHRRGSTGGRNRPHVNLIWTIEDLLGGRGGHTIDGTPLPFADLGAAACDCVLHRVVMAGGTVLDYGRATRTIPAPMFNALVVRDQHCRGPGCDRGPQWCDGHHVVAWVNGGKTVLTNLVLLCRRHHRLLHRPGWQARLLDDGTFEVRDPNGFTRSTRPPGSLVAAA